MSLADPPGVDLIRPCPFIRSPVAPYFGTKHDGDPRATLMPITGVPQVDGLLSGASWLLGPDRTLTWSLSDDRTYLFCNSAAAQSMFAAVLQQWANVANIRFQYVDSETLISHTADIPSWRRNRSANRSPSAFHADLRAAYGSDLQAATRHWIPCGLD